MMSTASPVPRSGSATVCAVVGAAASAGAAAGCSGAAAVAGDGSGGVVSSASGVCAAVSATASPATSISTMALPCETLSPTVTSTAVTVPARGDGTSIDALSDSSTTRVSSTAISSPALTPISITSTSPAPPRSGTLIVSLAIAGPLHKKRIGFVGINAKIGNGLGDHGAGNHPLLRQTVERRHRNIAAVHLEEVPQPGAGVAAPVAVGAEHVVVARNERPQLVAVALQVVGGNHERPAPVGQRPGDIGHPRRLPRVQAVPAQRRLAVAGQLVDTGDAPHIGLDLVVRLEQRRRRQHLVENGAGTEQLHPRRALGALGSLGVPGALLQRVEAADDALLNPRRHRRLHVVLVHRGDVVVAVLLVAIHPLQAVLD